MHRERGVIGECSAITVRLTAYWAGDIVADSQKRRLNFLFACGTYGGAGKGVGVV